MRLPNVMNPWHVKSRGSKGAECFWKILLAHMAHSLHAPPQLRCSLLNLLYQGPRRANCKVQARRFQGPVLRIMQIIEDVDATTKSHMTINHTQLAMQPAPSTGNEQTQRA